MTLPPEHTQWFSRVFEAETRSWAYLAATAGKAVGLTLVVAPFLVLFWSPLLPEALAPPVRFGPMVWLGFLLGGPSSLGQSVIARRIRRRLGAPPAALSDRTPPVTLIPYSLARRALHRRTVTAVRQSERPAQGWVATGLWLYTDVLLVVVVGALVVGMISGRLTLG